MVLDWEDLCFCMEVVYWGHFDAAGGGSEGGVLNILEFLDIAGGSVGEPYGTCISEK